ncbi:MAG: serine/threonine-protein phosphatase [Leptonema sp. (in: Bacteria)]|nr:serine/threonine-protein phosphatase [Leptonema sp. (in: bacteria)]
MDDLDILQVLFEHDLLPVDRKAEIIADVEKRTVPLGAFLVKNRYLSEKKLYQFIIDELGMNSSETFKFKDYRIKGRTISKFRTNGDFFGIFPLPNSRVAVTLCDVAGKGIEAALLTIHLAKLLRGGIDMTSVLPASFMKKINQVSRAFFEIDRYSTFVFIIIDLLSGTVEYSAAGSPPILRYDYRENSVSELELPNIPIGIFDDFQFRGSRTDLNSGDALLIFSDGAYEGENLKGRPYGIPRIKRVFKSKARLSIGKILRAMVFDWRMHEIFRRQADDTTYVIMRRIKKSY